MNRRTTMVGVVAVALVLAGTFLALHRPGKDAAKAPAGSEAAQTLGIPTAANAATPVTLPEGANATEVYAKVNQEVTTLSQKAMNASSSDEQASMFDQIEGLYEAFRTKYGGTPEALDAAFQLGAMDYSLQRYDAAVALLGEFITKAADSEHEKVAYAHFYLAESYKGLGKYDNAEGEYKTVLGKYSNVNQRLTQYAQTNLSGLAAERKIAIGQEPIDFSVKGLHGETLTPSAYKGKVLLIDFWATWCGPCIAEMPNVKNIYGKYHKDGLEIVGISLDRERGKLDAYIQQHDITWPQYFDGKWWNNDVARLYGIQQIPTSILVDKHGKIRYKSLRGKQLEDAVEKLLQET